MKSLTFGLSTLLAKIFSEGNDPDTMRVYIEFFSPLKEDFGQLAKV